MINKKVFCVGVFDLFHIGHRAFLKKASQFGDLTVGVVCDKAVKKQKGANRPIFNRDERTDIIYDLRYVKDTVGLNDFYIPPMITNEYDYIIIGEDQTHIKNQSLIPYEKKIIFPRYEGISTSKLIERIKKL